MISVPENFALLDFYSCRVFSWRMSSTNLVILADGVGFEPDHPLFGKILPQASVPLELHFSHVIESRREWNKRRGVGAEATFEPLEVFHDGPFASYCGTTYQYAFDAHFANVPAAGTWQIVAASFELRVGKTQQATLGGEH